MAREITNHGQPGYRRGCRCEACRKGHRESVAAWRATKRQPKDLPPARDQLSDVPALDLAAPAGPVEAALVVDLRALVGEPPWRGTLSQMALYNARLLDQITVIDRLDLVSPIQIRMMEIFDRLRAVSAPGQTSQASLSEQAGAFLHDLGTP